MLWIPRVDTRRTTRVAVGCAVTLVASGCSLLLTSKSHVDPATAGPDYAVQGEYVSENPPFGAQVVARGHGDFEAVLYRGGLPGAGWDRSPRIALEGEREDGRLDLTGGATLALENDSLVGTGPDGEALALIKIERESPTLRQPPPPGARVVFDGSGTEDVDGTMNNQGLLLAGAESRRSFRDFKLHLEFRTPFTPDGDGQFRGNSGVYLQDRYEVQVLDSFGLPEKDNDCGGIYQVSPPAVNMSFPPLRWQTYDIDFTAARWDAEGNKTAPARVTVRHNGVVIQDDTEIPGPTGGGAGEADTPGPIHLQDHWDPVTYRNVWVLPK